MSQTRPRRRRYFLKLARLFWWLVTMLFNRDFLFCFYLLMFTEKNDSKEGMSHFRTVTKTEKVFHILQSDDTIRNQYWHENMVVKRQKRSVWDAFNCGVCSFFCVVMQGVSKATNRLSVLHTNCRELVNFCLWYIRPVDGQVHYSLFKRNNASSERF